MSITVKVSRYDAANWIREAVLNLNPRPRALAIFGSFCRGEEVPANDVDLLIIGDSLPRRPGDRSKWIQPVVSGWRHEVTGRGWPFPMTLSPLFLSEEGWRNSFGLRLSLSEKAWILLDDGTLVDSLDEARKWREEGKWRKELIPSGGFFWIPSKGVA